jgi:hypothetical protein
MWNLAGGYGGLPRGREAGVPTPNLEKERAGPPRSVSIFKAVVSDDSWFLCLPLRLAKQSVFWGVPAHTLQYPLTSCLTSRLNVDLSNWS